MSYENRRAIRRGMWGLVLIGVGIAFLLDQMGMWHLRSLVRSWWDWWPAMLIVFGFANMITPLRPQHIASGLFFIMLGLWFFACQGGWYGLSYHNGWPLLIVASGLNMVLGATLERIWRTSHGSSPAGGGSAPVGGGSAPAGGSDHA